MDATGLLAGGQVSEHGGEFISSERTSLNFQGYMEGAVRSGRRAAREIG